MRWNTLLAYLFQDPNWARLFLHPSTFEPCVKVFMQGIFAFVVHLYSNTYGPDHFYTNLYSKILDGLYKGEMNEDLSDAIRSKIPKEFQDWYSIGNTMKYKNRYINISRASIMMEYLESPEFVDLLSDLMMKQSNYDLSNMISEEEYNKLKHNNTSNSIIE